MRRNTAEPSADARRGGPSGQHRLVFVEDLDALPCGVALWSPPTDATRPHQHRALHEAIARVLTDKQRAVIELYFFEGLSQGAIARRLGVSQQVVHKRLFGDLRGARRVGGAIARLRAALAAAQDTLHPRQRARRATHR